MSYFCCSRETTARKWKLEPRDTECWVSGVSIGGSYGAGDRYEKWGEGDLGWDEGDGGGEVNQLNSKKQRNTNPHNYGIP